MLRYAHYLRYMPFNLGPRGCIGASVANIELKMLLVSVLSKFRVALPAGTPRHEQTASSWRVGGAKLMPSLTLAPAGAKVVLQPL